jgi:Nucleotidyltransferase domain
MRLRCARSARLHAHRRHPFRALSTTPAGCGSMGFAMAPAGCGSMGFAMAIDVKAPGAALAERERVIRAIRDHEAELRALGVTQLWLFGSLARGDGGRRSDVDVLISVPPGRKFSLLDSPRCGSSSASFWAATPTS